MRIEIEPQYEMIDGEEIAVWQIFKNDGTLLIDLDKAIDEGITECYWLNEFRQFMIVEYSDWNSNEFIAIVNCIGKIVRKGISFIEDYVEKYNLFIISISGNGLGEDALGFDMEYDDTKMAVIDQYGDFYIHPFYDSLEFDEEENVLYAKRYHGEIKHRFRIGEQLPELLKDNE
jgi:hypothetical protein